MTPAVLAFSALGLIYAHAGYRLLLEILSRRTSPLSPPPAPRVLPKMSVIVAARDERETIVRRIRNLREQDYPANLLEIIVASDGSVDETAELARKEGARVLEFAAGRGRASVHNDAVDAASGEVLVFTDAETVFDPAFLRECARWISDPAYGCGSGDYVFQPQGSVGPSESLYWRMEKALRQLEHRLGVLPFVSGGCLVVRKSLYASVPAHCDVDEFIPYRLVADGWRVFYARDARACDVTAADDSSHYRKRVRGALHGFQGVMSALPALARRGRWGVCGVLLSHRLARWGGGWFMLAALIANGALAGQGVIYDAGLAVQAAFYLSAAAGVAPIRSFVLANAAFIDASFRWAFSRRITVYQPVSRPTIGASAHP